MELFPEVIDRSDSGTDRAHVDVDLDDREAALLREALSLTHETDPSRVLKLALKELVERQRFRSWVDRHEGR